MWVIIMEVVVAVSLLFLIVWATRPRRRKSKQQEKPDD